MEAQSYLDLIFRPPELDTFYQGDYDVVLKIWRQGEEFETLELGAMPGFFTIQDVKRQLYARKRSDEYIPRFVFMGIPLGDVNKAPNRSTRYAAADFTWVREKSETPVLYSPLSLLKMSDSRFTDATGQWGTYKENKRDSLCLEDAPLARTDDNRVIFHVFTLGRLLSGFQRPRPLSIADWNTRFGMFFPRVPNTGPESTPTAQDQKDMRDVMTYLTRKKQRVDMLDSLLTTTATPEASIKGIQRLRLKFKPSPEFESTEMMFYSLLVNHRRPFLRLLKPTGEPMNKLFTKDTFYPPRPDIEDPNLLRQWSQQEAPDATEDFLFGKILLREIRTSQKPLYATLRVFQDGSSDVIVLPLKQERILDVGADLGSLEQQLTEGLEGTGADLTNVELGDMTAVFSLEIDQDDAKIDRKELERRLPCFSPFFQLTPIYTTEVPQMMVRYKAISNFEMEDIKEKRGNIQTYIQFLAEKERVKGDNQPPAAWIPKIAEEFQISISEATSHLESWALKRSEFVIVNPTTDDIMEGNHPGIDIAIFENHPSYSFHIYGVNSPKSFARIVMLMRLMLGLSADQLVCSQKAAADFEQAEESLGENKEAPAGSSAASGGFGNLDMGMNANQGMIDTNLLEQMAGEEQPEEEAAEAAGEEEEAAPAAAPSSELTEEDLKGRTSKDAPVVQNWIISLLLKSDPELFDYARGGGKVPPYSRKCQATMDAQPIVMTRQQFEKNYRMYRDQSIVFPIRGEQPPVMEKTEEVFTFLRYSSSPSLDLFYTCPAIFCVRDFMIIRRDDFKSSVGHDKKRKDPFTCPFCRGTVIEDKTKAVPNATVLVRAAKNHAKLKFDGRDKVLRFIGFQNDDSHPKGFNFPCCFLKPQAKTSGKSKQYTLTADNPAFAEQTKWLRESLLGRLDMNTVVQAAEEAEAETTDEEEGDDATSMTGTVANPDLESRTKLRPFIITLNDLPNEYIQEANKLLIHGKVAILTKALGDYFEQDSKAMVKVIGSKQTLTPSAKGFLRVGVGNTPRNRPDSLLACLAPLLGKTHFSEVKQLILDRITPRVFIHLNYGNLVHEYFNPNDPEPAGDVMAKWAADHINIRNDAANKMAISRYYRSYRRFISDISSGTSRKQLRVFADILQHPGVLYSTDSSRCLVLVTLEADVLNPNAPIRVLCPPYGVSPYARDNADIAFIVRFVSGDSIPYYEPLLYTENYPATATTNATHQHYFVLQRAAMRNWSNTVRVRVREFMDKCEGPGRQVYASHSAIDPYAMISISQLKTFLGVGTKALGGRALTVSAVLRDSSNHVAGLLYQVGTHNRYVMVPCVDDGTIYPEIPHVELDYEGWPAATVDEIIFFYTQFVRHRFNALYPGYEPKAQIRTIYDTRVVAVQLANGLMIPATPPRKPVKLPEAEPRKAQIEWRINKAIAEGGDEPVVAARAAVEGEPANIEHVNELYEHFRVSFANWLMGDTATNVKAKILQIIENPGSDLADKRKRLDIELRSTIEKWLDPDQGYEVTPFEFLRRDCISITDDPSKCSGVCRWRETTAETEVKCRIHVPSTAGVKQFSTVELFCQRLYDELIRIPFKRNELLKNRVARLHPPVDAIYDEKQHQWILPDNSSDWLTLKRLEWATEEFDKPRYFEEMSSSPEEKTGSEFLNRLPADVIAFLGEGAEKLFQWQPATSDLATREPYIVFAPMLGFAFSEPDIGLPRPSTEMTQEAATKAARKSGKMLIFANFTKKTFIVGRPPPTQPVKSYTLFLEQEGQIPSLLVSSPKSSGIPLEELPSAVKKIITTTAKPLMLRRTVPAVAAQAAAKATI